MNALSAAAVALFALGCSPPPLFEAITRYSVGAFPVALVNGTNQNGAVDLLSANWSSGDLTLLTGSVAGAFSTAATFPVGANPNSIAVGNFDSDSRPDIVAADESGSLAVILNGLPPATIISLSGNPAQVVITDLNLDGKSDIVALEPASSSVVVLLGNGNGNFAAPVSYGCGDNAVAIAVADTNTDGRPDVVGLSESLSAPARLEILDGFGDGTLARTPIEQDVGSSADSIIAVDINSDGFSDLLMTDHHDDQIIVFFGTGANTFTQKTTYATALAPTAIVAADVDGQFGPDAIVATASGFVTILINDGMGHFHSRTELPTGGAAQAITAADFRGINRIDIAVALSPDNAVGILLSNPSRAR